MDVKHSILLALLMGILLGIVAGVAIGIIFQPALYFRERLSYPAMLSIFLKNSVLVTLICYGGIVFARAELEAYRFRIYKYLDKIYDPLYSFLSRISKTFKALKPMWRSCYLSIFYFPLGCIFLIFFLIATYFSMFLWVLGIQAFPRLVKLFPHLTLEILAFVLAANMALKIAEDVKKYILAKRARKFKAEIKRYLYKRAIWKFLLALYLLLLISALVEKFFVE